MVDKICTYLTDKIRKAMPEVDDERAEVIYYGVELIIGEIPKIFIILLIAWALGIFCLALLTFLIILPYRMFSGGLHLKSHIGCIVGTTVFYCGTVLLSKNIVLEPRIFKIYSYCISMDF